MAHRPLQISRQFRRLIYWNAHASSSFEHTHWGWLRVYIKVFSKRIRRCSVDGRKRYEDDKCRRKSWWKRSKTAPFSFENGLVWTGPQLPNHDFKEALLTNMKSKIERIWYRISGLNRLSREDRSGVHDFYTLTVYWLLLRLFPNIARGHFNILCYSFKKCHLK